MLVLLPSTKKKPTCLAPHCILDRLSPRAFLWFAAQGRHRFSAPPPGGATEGQAVEDLCDPKSLVGLGILNQLDLGLRSCWTALGGLDGKIHYLQAEGYQGKVLLAMAEYEKAASPLHCSA